MPDAQTLPAGWEVGGEGRGAARVIVLVFLPNFVFFVGAMTSRWGSGKEIVHSFAQRRAA